ncbi:MAG: thiol:disulfide interchange protein DsbA/DsbL [Wenzhouxiangellaceae bacterium]
MTDQHRSIPISLSFLGAALLAVSWMPLAAAQDAPFQEGTHYEVIDRPPVDDDTDVVEVVEVFSYMCPHCANFEPHVEPWSHRLPEGVQFRRVPVSFNRSWEPFARAYYTAEVLGILDQSHPALFKALHQERKALRGIDDLAGFHAQFGVDADRFKSTAQSFAVESMLRMGNASIARWQVRSTPTLVIDGKYRVSPRRGGTFEEMLAVADWLIERELAGKQSHQTEAADADEAETATDEQ